MRIEWFVSPPKVNHVSRELFFCLPAAVLFPIIFQAFILVFCASPLLRSSNPWAPAGTEGEVLVLGYSGVVGDCCDLTCLPIGHKFSIASETADNSTYSILLHTGGREP